MKVNNTTFNQLSKIFSHPSSALFRAIELKAIYEQVGHIVFHQPSLDLGCGDGAITQLLFDQQFTYGVDNGEADDVDIAIKNNVYKNVLIESAEKMSLPDNSVNFVFSNSVIEHIPDNESVLSEVSRILIKGGDFVFTSPSNLFREYLYIPFLLNKWGLGLLGKYYKKKRNAMLNHYHILSHTTWIKRLNKYGLKVIKYAYYIPEETLHLWDKMAFQIFFSRFFKKDIENNMARKYRPLMESYYSNGTDDKTKGASLLIYAKKE